MHKGANISFVLNYLALRHFKGDFRVMRMQLFRYAVNFDGIGGNRSRLMASGSSVCPESVGNAL